MPPKAKPPVPPTTTQQLTGVLNSAASGIETLIALTPGQTKEVQDIITNFLANTTITKLMGTTHSSPPLTTPPPDMTEALKTIMSSLTALQKASSIGTPAGKPTSTSKPDSNPHALDNRAKGKSNPSTFAQAAASPPRPSMVVSLAHVSWTDNKPTPAQVCNGINCALEVSDNDQVCISATRWTARDNMILTGGPNTMAQHLQQATPTICHHLATTYLTSDEPDSPPSPPTIRPNVKWSKLLINSVPTGVSPLTKAMTPDECNTALISDNPSYATLNITQKPNWVHNPTSYTEGAVSSLIVAFEDPDSSLARGLQANKVLFIFGHCTTLRKWKQRPTTSNPTPTPAADTPTHNLTTAAHDHTLPAVKGHSPNPPRIRREFK
jgi:hypothetical protein